MATFKPFLLLISFLALALVSSSIPLRGLNKGDFKPCELGLNVKTLSDPCAGTTSNVSIRLIYWRGGVTIPNLVEWNSLPPPPPPPPPFQAGQLDTLAGPVNCNEIRGPPCYLTVTITGTGHSPTWGLEYIEVRSPEFTPITFQVNEWLTPENNYTVYASRACPRFSTGMSGSTESSIAIWS